MTTMEEKLKEYEQAQSGPFFLRRDKVDALLAALRLAISQRDGYLEAYLEERFYERLAL